MTPVVVFYNPFLPELKISVNGKKIIFIQLPNELSTSKA